MSTIIAKFVCNMVQDQTFKTGSSRRVFLSAVYSGSEENKSFSKATPSGQLEMSIDKDTLAYDLFKPGQEYYLEFKEAPAR